MRVGVDLDDVLYPLAETMHDIAEQAGLHDGTAFWEHWEMWRSYDCTRDEWERAIKPAIHDGSLYRRPPYLGVIPQLYRLRDAGHTLHIVTARGAGIFGGKTMERTVAWLREWGVPYDSLTFTTDKTVVDANVYIDDALHNVQHLEEAGKMVALLDRPHNRDHHNDTTWRVSSLTEFVDALLDFDFELVMCK